MRAKYIYKETQTCLWTFGLSRSTQREPTQTCGQLVDLNNVNPKYSCCEAIVLTTNCGQIFWFCFVFKSDL